MEKNSIKISQIEGHSKYCSDIYTKRFPVTTMGCHFYFALKYVFMITDNFTIIEKFSRK
jgi:hypothetical protein